MLKRIKKITAQDQYIPHIIPFQHLTYRPKLRDKGLFHLIQ